ncbi:hypothetical protein X474_27600 [Dethiosulfatarculus sandiegensis]|uniref:Uncharacterized protein n=1 Tax=Dethiosulfatarculus sandiegensis TaxID=1429043 RepID=A0A0D2G755_9BACT|nr:hypothetical protein X474_27600 [Dethiosulfatarculus sandiegensis]
MPREDRSSRQTPAGGIMKAAGDEERPRHASWPAASHGLITAEGRYAPG